MKTKQTSDLFNGISSGSLKGEDGICNRLSIFLKDLYFLGKLKCVWTHIANERPSSTPKDYFYNNKLKKIGVISGAPDYIFAGDGKILMVEMKKKGGKLSENQELYKKWCQDCNVDYNVFYDEIECINELIKYGFIENLSL